MVYADKHLVCRDCGQPFTFTVGEQEFHGARGFTNDPSRCQECRQIRRARQNGQSGLSALASARSPQRQMYPVRCDSCGTETQVPFEPRNDKPVYCRDCFTARRSSASSYH